MAVEEEGTAVPTVPRFNLAFSALVSLLVAYYSPPAGGADRTPGWKVLI